MIEKAWPMIEESGRSAQPRPDTNATMSPVILEAEVEISV